jgi:hypothetical protein
MVGLNAMADALSKLSHLPRRRAWEDADIVRMTPGDYEVIYVGHRVFEQFGGQRLHVHFRLTEFDTQSQIILPAYYVIKPTGERRWQARRGSKLVRQLMTLYPNLCFKPREIQGRLQGLLSNRIFLARVTDVATDNQQNTCPAYSKVETILEVVTGSKEP